MENLNKEMLVFVNCILAKNMTYKEGKEIFEAAGWDERNRFDESVSDFIEKKAKELKTKLESASNIDKEKSFKLDYKSNKYNHSTLDGEPITDIIVKGYDSIRELECISIDVLHELDKHIDVVIKSKNNELVIEEEILKIINCYSVTNLLVINQDNSRLELNK